MKSLLRVCGLLLLLAWLPAAWAQSPPAVTRINIKHIGPVAVSEDLIRANIRTRTGEPYRSSTVDDDVRNLYSTGLFYNIRVTDERADSGVALTYFVQANPRLTEIKFEGNTRFTDKQLRKKISSKVGAPLDERKLFTDSQEIQKFYQKKGYPGTVVKAVPNILQESARAVAVFQINESRKIRIADIQFIGANAFPEKKLRKVIKTRRRWALSWLTGSGVYKEDEFEDDRERLTQFYRDEGYIDFEITDVRFEHPTPGKMAIQFVLDEGRQYKVGSVRFTGEKGFTDEEITQGLRALQPRGAARKPKTGPNGLIMDVGDVFSPKGLNQDRQQVEDFYGARGYLDPASGRSLHIVRVPNTETGTMDLEFDIDRGQKSFVEKIEIRGNTKTKDRVIRRELAISPGEVYDKVRVDLSKQRLLGLNYFEKVETRPEPTDIPTRQDLIIAVEEKNTGNLTVGAAFSSVDALVGFTEVTQGNFDLFNPPTFTGGGQKFRLKAQIGTERQDYEAQFIEPWFLDRKLVLDVNLFYRDLDFLSLHNLYRQIDAGTRISLTRALGSDFLIGTAGYSFENIGIIFNHLVYAPTEFPGGPTIPGEDVSVPQTLLDEQGYALVTKFFGSIAYDTRGADVLPGQLPNKGQRTSLGVELAGPFGGEKNYYKLEVKTHWYFKGLFSGHVLELLGGTGVADSYGSTDSVPFYDRYYLGGLTSVRGFRYHGISPRESGTPEGFASKEPIGGNTYWFGSAEYSLPVIERVRFAVFYDAGNVMLSPYTYDWSNWNDNWGVGLRLHLPIGDLRFDYGVPIHHDKYNGGSGRFQFSVGPYRQW